WATRAVAQAVPQAEPLLQEALATTARRSREVGLAGLLTLLWSASNVFVQLEAAFRVIWEAQPARSFWQARLVGVLLTLLTALVLLLTAVGRVALEVALRSVRALPYGAHLWQWGALGASLGLTGLFLAALYRFVPPVEVRASDVWPAAAFGALAWEALRWGFGWYVSHANYRAIYGPVASVIAFLLWIYLASHVLFLGGEIAAARGRLRCRDLRPGQAVV
ncbi:MAG: YihY/virulence factor BrkB family protein, partial [Anaerolineae bacterium]|nr:YihY/virulence factor BrkB family protein [Anaerolineae bacterium]